jgi:hypothetical protein
MIGLGVVTSFLVNPLGGIIITVVGLLMYYFYRKLDKRSRSVAPSA